MYCQGAFLIIAIKRFKTLSSKLFGRHACHFFENLIKIYNGNISAFKGNFLFEKSAIIFSLRCDLLFSTAKKVGKNAAAYMKIAKSWIIPLKEKNSSQFSSGLKQLFFFTLH